MDVLEEGTNFMGGGGIPHVTNTRSVNLMRRIFNLNAIHNNYNQTNGRSSGQNKPNTNKCSKCEDRKCVWILIQIWPTGCENNLFPIHNSQYTNTGTNNGKIQSLYPQKTTRNTWKIPWREMGNKN